MSSTVSMLPVKTILFCRLRKEFLIKFCKDPLLSREECLRACEQAGWLRNPWRERNHPGASRRLSFKRRGFCNRHTICDFRFPSTIGRLWTSGWSRPIRREVIRRQQFNLSRMDCGKAKSIRCCLASRGLERHSRWRRSSSS